MLASGVFALLLFVLGGGPMLAVDWLRKRRQQEVAQQIALTDAIDGQVGVVVAPVVRKPLFGPWEIRITVPVDQSTTVAKILSVVDGAFGGVVAAGSRPYRIFLTARPDSLREMRAPGTPRSATRWAGHPIRAA
jgi:hypothetical protein